MKGIPAWAIILVFGLALFGWLFLVVKNHEKAGKLHQYAGTSVRELAKHATGATGDVLKSPSDVPVEHWSSAITMSKSAADDAVVRRK